LTEELLVQEATDRRKKIVKGRHVLCIQDTSEVSLTAHDNRITDKTSLGRLDYASYALGFKLHPALVMDAATLNPLGFSAIKLWHRPLDMPNRRDRGFRNLSIQDKESYKWIEVAHNSKEVLCDAEMVTVIQDREADIYKVFTEIPDKKHHLIVRSSFDRILSEGLTLSKKLAGIPISGFHTISLKTDSRVARKQSQVRLEIRSCKVSIQKPGSSKMKGCPACQELYVVEAKEPSETFGKDKIYWRLLTTHPVEGFEMALQIVEWYRCRWYIEQVFRLLKQKGFQIEETELESGSAIRKLTIIMLTAILKIIQMRLAYQDENEGQPIQEVYNDEEIRCLSLINRKLQGNTIKQQNVHDPTKTKWATWIIARLGGWKAYESQGPPGVIALKRGLERFGFIIEGVSLVQDMGTR
jgi:hypothetical protein